MITPYITNWLVFTNVDAMSRLPLKSKSIQVPTPGAIVLLVDHMLSNPIVSPDLPKIIFFKVCHAVKQGWLDTASTDIIFMSYQRLRD